MQRKDIKTGEVYAVARQGGDRDSRSRVRKVRVLDNEARYGPYSRYAPKPGDPHFVRYDEESPAGHILGEVLGIYIRGELEVAETEGRNLRRAISPRDVWMTWAEFEAHCVRQDKAAAEALLVKQRRRAEHSREWRELAEGFSEFVADDSDFVMDLENKSTRFSDYGGNNEVRISRATLVELLEGLRKDAEQRRSVR